MGKQVKYSPEVRERAVRMFQEHVHEHPSRWAAMQVDRQQDRVHDAVIEHVGSSS
jgi:hypothetical protein